MKRTILALTLVFACITLPMLVKGQKMKVLSGNFDFLKGQTALNVQFTYDDVTFYNENRTEQAYVDGRIKEITESKGAGEAEVWKKDWDYSKSTSFVNKFVTVFNKNIGIEAGTDVDAKYTIIVQTYWIFPGWFAGVMAQGAKISTKLIFVETANPSNVLLRIDSEKAPGNIQFVGVPNNNDRMAEGYAKTGKSLAKLISKKI